MRHGITSVVYSNEPVKMLCAGVTSCWNDDIVFYVYFEQILFIFFRSEKMVSKQPYKLKYFHYT